MYRSGSLPDVLAFGHSLPHTMMVLLSQSERASLPRHCILPLLPSFSLSIRHTWFGPLFSAPLFTLQGLSETLPVNLVGHDPP